MTIKDFVLNQKTAGINDWLELIQANNLAKHEREILECADFFDKIAINHNANFNTSSIFNTI